MAIYPEIKPDYGYSFIPQFRTDKLGPTDGDYTQRRRRRTEPLYQAILRYKNKSSADERTLMEFFEARDGSYDSFVFFDFASRVYPLMTIGTGDGAEKTFTLIHRDVTLETIYVNDVEQTADYSITNRTGANGQDQLVFDAAPGDTLVITGTYSGKKYLPYCIFDKDYLTSAAIALTRHQIATVVINQVNG